MEDITVINSLKKLPILDNAFFSQTFLGNSLADYLLFIIFLTLLFIITTILHKVILRRLTTIAEKTITKIDDLLVSNTRKYIVPLLYVGSFYLSLNILKISVSVDKVFSVIGYLLLVFYALKFFQNALFFIAEHYWLKRTLEKEAALKADNILIKPLSEDEQNERRYAFKVIMTVVKILIWTIALILVLDNMGVKISALVTGLGIGGIAIGFAAQAVLGDIFSYFTIFFDRPFQIGDFIIVDTHLGTIEHIGLKTTRLRSLSGEMLIFSNKDLTNSRVKNYKRMHERRVAFKIGVTYETPVEKLKMIPSMIQQIIENIENVRFDRAHFFSYGDFSLIYEIVYYVLGAEYNLYMDIQQDINFAIKEKFEEQNIDFAYPTSKVFFEKLTL